MNNDQLTGQLFIVSAPSGAGKTSLLKTLIAQLPELVVSVSHTTRKPRPGEVEGENYYFVTEAAFQQAIAREEFFEFAQVFGNYYGTSGAQIQQQLESGKNVILEIDWQGAQKVRRQIPQSISIFILPPSLQALEQRLQGRKQDADDVIQARMLQAREEITHYHEYDYLIINDRFEGAVAELQAIFVSENLKMPVQQALHKILLEQLTATDK